MALPFNLQRPLLKWCDFIFARLPQKFPGEDKLENCRIISHRGAHDNQSVFENTLPAFDRVLNTGVWGIEFDIRWTRDLHPVVFHDADLRRIFGSTHKISDLILSELKATFALVPTLTEVISRYGKKLHLMAEIKEESCSEPGKQKRILQDIFAPLEPITDFHFLSLDPGMFKWFGFVPSQTFLPIAETNILRLSAMSLRNGYGGILGHFLLLSDSILTRHRQRHQKAGTGFVNSKNCLYRELNRGIEWIFSENALALQTLCDRSRKLDFL